MPKRRISKQQQGRIKKIQSERLHRAHGQSTDEDKHLGPELNGLLVTHYGKYADVEYENDLYRCHFRQHLAGAVVGDHVVFRLDERKAGIIVAIAPRKNSLYRMDDRQQQKNIAANIDQMLVVMAKEPEPSTLLLDSYLVAAEVLGISPIIIFNKMDLMDEDFLNSYVAVYAKLGYPLLKLSVVLQQGIEELESLLNHKTNIFVGQSGVGKSSIISALLPDVELNIGQLHGATGLGKHTTTVSKLYHLPHGGDLIDSPGIREFSLWEMDAMTLAKGFKEFSSFVEQCKFRNCSHVHEPDCAVIKAMDDGNISLLRWENYKKLLA